MRIGFLFNHDQIHQVAHSLPIALALARDQPHFRITLAVTTEAIEAEVIRLAGDRLHRSNLELRRLKVRGGAKTVLAHLLQPIAPAVKLLVYKGNLHVFRALDALVVSEKTSLILKTRYGLEHLRMIHTRHGAGDRAIGFDKASARFDLILAAGPKIARRLISEAGVAPHRIRITGYPKFDLTPRGANPFPLDDRRLIVLYNPHASPHLSSWYREGPRILAWFAANPAYRLIFAPHVMLFRRKLAISVDRLSFARPGRIAAEIIAAPNIHIDLGSAASTDMTYTEAADIYLGDASSQVYEFLKRPRPCLFLNSAQADWKHDPNFAHWRAGTVIDRVEDLPGALATCARDHDRLFVARQHELFDDTFDLNQRPSSDRAAEAIAEFLATEFPRDRPIFRATADADAVSAGRSQ